MFALCRKEIELAEREMPGTFDLERRLSLNHRRFAGNRKLTFYLFFLLSGLMFLREKVRWSQYCQPAQILSEN